MLDYKKVFSELWKRAGYREKQKLVGNSKKVHKVQVGRDRQRDPGRLRKERIANDRQFNSLFCK